MALTVPAFLVAMPAAHADVELTETLTFPGMEPDSVDAGQSDLPASLTIENDSTAPDTGSITLGDITLMPSCGTESEPTAGECPLGSADPGVIEVGPTATGTAGGGCPGTAFTTAVTDADTGQVTFSSTSPVVLGPAGGDTAQCTIDFTVNVLKLPTQDSNPGIVGAQTAQSASATTSDDLTMGIGSSEVTVDQAAPSLTAHASGTVVVGHPISDTAALSNGASPTGTLTFEVFGPQDPRCVEQPLFTSMSNVAGDGSYHSTSFTPTVAGRYHWYVSYAGDVNNAIAYNVCGTPGQSVTVTHAHTATRLALSRKVLTYGKEQHERALVAVSTPHSNPAPTGKVIVNAGKKRLCTIKLAHGKGSCRLSKTKLRAGRYHLIARYSGNAADAPSSSPKRTLSVAKPRR